MTNVWVDPIFDRTLEDVEFAIQKIAEWKKSHVHLTDTRVEADTLVVRNEGETHVTDDTLTLQVEGTAQVSNDALVARTGAVYELKGCLNLSDINRIEGNIKYLADRMESYSYSPNIHSKRWSRVDLPNQNDMSRIIENIRALIGAFYPPHSPPELPTTMLSYIDINAIEENLFLLKQMLDCMESSFRKVGTIKSGSTTFLPIRR